MIYNKSVTAIILAAGNSIRYGKNINKNLELVYNKEVLTYSLETFNNNTYIDNIIITIKKDDLSLLTELLKKQKLNKEVNIIIGGQTRKESVYNAIKKTSSDIVIIHDGARPLIKDDYINICCQEMNNYKGVTVGVKSKDTIKITNDKGIVINTTNRSNTWMIQTPQCFDRNILLKAHEKYKDEDATDDCTLLEKDGYDIKVIESDYANIKITTNEDLEIVKKLIKKKTS